MVLESQSYQSLLGSSRILPKDAYDYFTNIFFLRIFITSKEKIMKCQLLWVLPLWLHSYAAFQFRYTFLLFLKFSISSWFVTSNRYIRTLHTWKRLIYFDDKIYLFTTMIFVTPLNGVYIRIDFIPWRLNNIRILSTFNITTTKNEKSIFEKKKKETNICYSNE